MPFPESMIENWRSHKIVDGACQMCGRVFAGKPNGVLYTKQDVTMTLTPGGLTKPCR